MDMERKELCFCVGSAAGVSSFHGERTLRRARCGPVVARTAIKAHGRVVCKLGGGQGWSGAEDSDGSDEVPELEGMNIQWKNNRSPWKDQRDLLPFDVDVITPPPHHLGRFRLDPRLNCGDIVDYEDQCYVVRRVRMHYSFKNGGFVVTRKTAEVKTIGRKSLESYLEKMYKMTPPAGDMDMQL